MRVHVRVRRKPDRDTLQLYYTDPITRRDRTKSAGTSNWRQAERAAAEWERELLSKLDSVEHCTWETLRMRFEDLRYPHMREASRNSCSSSLEAVERVLNPATPVGLIRAITIEQASAQWIREGLRPATVNTYLAWWKTVLRWAHRHSLLSIVPQFPDRRRVSSRGRPLVIAEMRHLLRTTRATRPDDWRQWARFLRGLWLTGLRISEAIALDWEAGDVVLRLTGGRYPAIAFTSAQKSGKPEITPLAPDAAAWLSRVPAGRRHGRVWPLVQIPGQNRHEGWVYERGPIQRTLGEIGEASGIVVDQETGKTVTAHDLRRSFGTRWSYRVRPLTLQKMMRHASLDTTMTYYVHQQADEVAAELWGQ